MSNALIAPIKKLQMKMTTNEISVCKLSQRIVSSLKSLLLISRYMTIPIASLKIDSPKMIEYKLISAFISLKIDSTLTGSVAEIKLENAKLFLKSMFGVDSNFPR